jgi:hypothetical protein
MGGGVTENIKAFRGVDGDRGKYSICSQDSAEIDSGIANMCSDNSLALFVGQEFAKSFLYGDIRRDSERFAVL